MGASLGDGFAGRSVGGRQTEWSRVSRMAERHCGVMEAGAVRRKGAHAFAAEGGDRSGEREDAEALQDGRRATTAGRLTAASRCGLAAQRNGDVPTATVPKFYHLTSSGNQTGSNIYKFVCRERLCRRRRL